MAFRRLTPLRLLPGRQAAVRSRASQRPIEARVPHQEDHLVTRTIELWERCYGRTVSQAEAQEILHNLSTFFDLLAEWDRASGDEPLDQSKGERAPGGEG